MIEKFNYQLKLPRMVELNCLKFLLGMTYDSIDLIKPLLVQSVDSILR